MVLHYAPPVPHRSSHRVTTDPQIGGDPLIGLSVVHRSHHDFPRLRAENVFVYGIGQVCFGMAHVFILLSKKLANDACLWDNAVTKEGKKMKKRNQYGILLASFWGFCFWFGLSGYIRPFRRIGRLMKQNSIIFNRGIITVSWH